MGELLRNAWATPRESARLSPGDVQIWRLDLTSADGQSWVEAGWDLLSADEVVRARRMRAGISRDELVAGRAALRCLLARELACQPLEVEFRLGKHGKPSLMRGDLAFNVAHSRGMALIALSLAGPVGIDVEDSARPVEALDVARAAFHPDELRFLEGAPEAQQAAVFYRCWTRKEAVTKADGRGLTLPSASYSVVHLAASPQPETMSRKNHYYLSGCGYFTDDVTILDGYDENYYLTDLYPGRGFVAALARCQRICPIMQFDLFPPAARSEI